MKGNGNLPRIRRKAKIIYATISRSGGDSRAQTQAKNTDLEVSFSREKNPSFVLRGGGVLK